MSASTSASNSAMLPVVFINGLGAPAFAANAYARIFRGKGLRAFAVSPSVLGFGDLRRAAARVGEEVERVRRETGAAKVNLVGMSLGGLIGLYYVKCAGGAAYVER